MTLNDKYLRFKEYLENGGLEKIFSIDLLEDLKIVRLDSDKNVIPESVTSLVMAAFNALAGSHLSEPFISDTFIEEYRSFNQKDLYFSQQRIDTEAEFDKIYNEYEKLQDTIFRGVSEAKWRLLNSLQRFWIKEKFSDKKISYQEFVLKLIEKARLIHNNSLVRYLNDLRLDSENDIAILSFLQHYGTGSYIPLLDWTYNFKHSLFFAIDNLDIFKPQRTEIESYFSIYYLEEKFFEDGDLSIIVKKVLAQDAEKIFQKSIEDFEDVPADKLESFKNSMTDNAKKHFAYQLMGKGAIRHITKIENLIKFPIAFFSDKNLIGPLKCSVQNNFNIINQQGAFVWNYSPTKPLEYIAKEEYLKENSGDFFFCYCLNINKKLKYYIKNKLDNDGITLKCLYPNPDDIANESFNETKKIYCP